MLEFQELALEDIRMYRCRFGCNCDRICDCTAGTTFMWRKLFHTEYAVAAESLILKFQYVDGKRSFAFPLCGDAETALDEIASYCVKSEENLRFSFTSARDRDIILKKFPNAKATAERDWFDYVYEAQALVTLSGKRYHGQKNFVNRFKKLYPDYRFVVIDETNLERVRAYMEMHVRKFPKESVYIGAELDGIFEALDQYALYGMCGGFIEVGDAVTGVSIGEIVGDTLYVHIEKADTEYPGAYPILTNEFAKAFVRGDTRYINREEDMGEEGLRTSKLSYHPAFLAEKYTITVSL